jgi:PAS domain S-box-containing protein
MAPPTNPPQAGFDEDSALRAIVEGTATVTGEQFFAALVESLAKVLDTHGAWVTEYLEESRRLRALAFWLGGEWVHNYEHAIDGTPCQPVVEGARIVHYPDKVLEIYPDEPDLKKFGALSYMGAPLLDVSGKVLGHLAVLDTKPMPAEPRLHAVFRIFAARAAAELQRLRAEADLREREEKLARLLDSAMDAIVELDATGTVIRLNAAAEKIFGESGDRLVGRRFGDCLAEDSRTKLDRLMTELDARPEGRRYLWIPGGLTIRCPNGVEIQAEATLSRFAMQHRTFHTLILRNVNERLEAERKIQCLTAETEYLKEEIRSLTQGDEILGQSPALRHVLRDIQQVAPTDATVLILGETGTGKELVARAIHAASGRKDKPLIAVNCAAIPSTLMESELFGHEPGAFTGATKKREGRFGLADGGTIFLDEVGELPLDLQAKLLRVLQEGEFEPVGSSRTRKVNVRIIAATNRDLQRSVTAGTFRQDLYYRLNVFPLSIPPLRERGEDIVLLASAFAQRFGQRMGRRIEPLSDSDRRRLSAYAWPGNVRELQNVIERAVITAQEGRLNLDRALPESATARAAEPPPIAKAAGRVLTMKEIEEIERAAILQALEAAAWRVSGEKGAAKLLDMNPSTLSSRMKALGIKKHR